MTVLVLKGIFKSQTLLFISASSSSFFFYLTIYLYTLSSKSFSTSFVAQRRIMAKHFSKQRVSDLIAITNDDNRVKIPHSIGILK